MPKCHECGWDDMNNLFCPECNKVTCGGCMEQHMRICKEEDSKC
jgi:hypothetical protein